MSGIICLALLGLLGMTSVAAAAESEIVATPGTYELVEGASMQFDGRPKKGSRKISRYRWEIISGGGAKLLNKDQSRVTFVAPVIKEKSRQFTLQLTSHYQNAKPSKAQINIRVHKKSKNSAKRSSSPWVSGSIGFGFGYLWGGWWPYPPLIVIVPPPPGEILPPEEIPPIAVPLPEDPSYEDWIKDNPDFGGADYGDAELLPESDLEGLSPEPGLEAEPMPVTRDIEPGPDIVPAPLPEAQPLPVDEPEVFPAEIPEPMLMDDVPMDMDMDMDMGFD